MLLNDAIAGAQAKSGALSHRAGCIEGIKHAFWFDCSGPVIAKFEDDVSAFQTCKDDEFGAGAGHGGRAALSARRHDLKAGG